MDKRDLDHAHAAIELVRATAAEARCKALLLEGEPLEAHLECIVLEQSLAALGRMELFDIDSELLSALRRRFVDLAARVYGQSRPSRAT